MLVHLAMERQPAPWSPPPAVYHELRQRLVTRDAVLDMRTQRINQRHALQQWPVIVPAVLAQLDAMIVDFEAQISTLTSGINQVLQESVWADSATLLQTIPGVGILTTAWLLVGTLNFTISEGVDQLTSYVGLAPMPWESGTSIRRRPQIGHGGDGRLRQALYLATLSGARHNPVLREQYRRLRNAGKPMKVARCAVARKLLHIAWAVVTHQQPFEAAHGRGSVVESRA